MDLRTVKDVEIVSTGTYSLDSGTTEFTADMLADAVRASTDSTIVAPRLKLGHTSKLNDVLGDGEPAFGQVRNLRLAKNGQTIVGDLENVPAWLADNLPAHYPGRSIEGGMEFKAPSGHEYGMVISALALLGSAWPGVTSLEDLQAVVTANGRIENPVKVEDGEGFKLSGGQAASLVNAKLPDPPDISAALEVGNFRSVFAKDLRAGRIPKMIGAGDQLKWWPRSVEAGDDGSLSLTLDDSAGKIIQLPVKVNGEGLTYGEPSIRQAVAASGPAPRVLASWASTGESPSTQGSAGMTREQMLKRLGLAEDATDEAIVKATAEKPEALSATGDGDDEGGDGSGDGDGDESGDGDEGSAVSTEGATLVTASGQKIKLGKGMTLIDSETLGEVRSGAKAGAEVAATLAEQNRDGKITAAIKEGKFAVGRREHYEKAWDADAEGTEALIASLAPGLIPVSEIGRAGDGDAQTGDEDAAMQQIYARHFPELVTATKE